MDDVDYLVEDNARNDFCLSSEMGGTHGRLAQRQVHAGNKHLLLGMFQPSYLPEIQIRFVKGYFRLSMSEKKVCNTNRRYDVARFSGNELR